MSSLVVIACSLLLLLSSASAAAPAAVAKSDLEQAATAVAATAGDLANALTFSPEQIASAETVFNSTTAAVFAAVNATKAAKAAFFQDAIAAPFGQLRAGGLRAGGLVKRTNRTAEKADWLTSELALAPFARAFSQVSAAVDSSPVGKAFAATKKPSSPAAAGEAAAAAGVDSRFALPTPREVLARAGGALRLPGGGPAEDVAAAIAEEEERAESSAAAAEQKAAASKKAVTP
jgi:hypothetical protein